MDPLRFILVEQRLQQRLAEAEEWRRYRRLTAPAPLDLAAPKPSPTGWKTCRIKVAGHCLVR